MSRWFTVGLLSTLSGCIIYEQRYVPIDRCEGRCVDTGTVTAPTGTDNPPGVTDSVRLTVREASPGDVLLSYLVPAEAGVDIATIETLSFERDITVLDSDRQANQITLVLAVSETADPGDVAVSITTGGGGSWILAEPFRILGGTTSTGGGTTADTGSATP